MKTWKVFGLAALVAAGLLVLNGPAQAQYWGDNINQRMVVQEQRIREGMRSGALTYQEAARLEAEQQRIRATAARMQADGRLDRRDRRILEEMLDKAERDIYREKHDRNTPYPNYGNHSERRYRHWQETH